jgi:outer membrane protein OmpA-like peptidoglycan-associated protein
MGNHRKRIALPLTVLLTALVLAGGLGITAAQQAARADDTVVGTDELIDKLTPKKRFRSLTRVDDAPPAVDLDIRFEFNSHKLTPAARAQLDSLGQALSSDSLRTFRFKIAGHTDSVGSDSYNKQLSEERAAEVRTYLMRTYGIAPDRLASVGLGESQLKMPQDPENGANRRVEVINLGE